MIEDMLRHYGDQVRIHFRFNVEVDREDSDSNQVACRLLEIYHQSGEADFRQAMDEIYEHQNAQKWMKQWGRCKPENPHQNTLNRQKQWLIDNALNFTPVLIVNGKAFPKEYDHTDLKLFVEELAENAQQAQPELSV